MDEHPPSGGEPRTFLPDFCDFRSVFAVVVAGELLAFVLSLGPGGHPSGFWAELALVSLFVQWVGLSSTALLCAVRRALVRLGNVGAGIASYLLVLGVTAALAEAAFRLVLPDTGAPGHLALHLRSQGISAIVAAAVLRYLYVQNAWRERVESESRARVQALQSRIRPHFLFNSMNTIASLARSDPPLAEQVTEDLADLFRVSLGDASVPVTLASELDVCRRYLRIEAQRLGERLRFEFEVDGLPGDALLPALSLQPLLENAVYHGVEPSAEGARVRVAGTREGDRLRLRVANTVSEAGASARPGNRMARDNVAERLQAYYGGDASLVVDGSDAGEYAVVLDLPYRRRVE